MNVDDDEEWMISRDRYLAVMKAQRKAEVYGVDYQYRAKFLKRDYPGLDYASAYEEYLRQEDAVLDHTDRDWLAYIHRHGLAAEPREFDGLGFREIEAVYHDIMDSKMVELGYIEVKRPTLLDTHLPEEEFYDEDEEGMCYNRGFVAIEAHLTKVGSMALRLAEQDVLWSITYHRPLYEQSMDEWTTYLHGVSFDNKESVFSRISELGHSMYDALKEEIPKLRAQVWRDHLRRCWPYDRAWDNLRYEKHPGLDEVRAEMLSLHRDSWIRTIPNFTRFDDPNLQKAFYLGTEYADIVEMARDRHIALWIARVQTIIDPESPVFVEVEALSDVYHLVKAEAFLQKMKCWTPLDEHGRRV